MFIVSTEKGDFNFYTIDDVLNFAYSAAHENNEIWIRSEQANQYMAVCINGEYAAINYFENDTGDMWLSYNDENREKVTFIAAGEEWEPDVSAVISLKNAFTCIMEFCTALEKPYCIKWQNL